jgi:uncharacterized protein YciI
MPAFVLYCIDKPDSLALRMATREAHLAYIGRCGPAVSYGGPLLDAKGDMAGSLIVFEGDDMEAARAFSAADPYVQAGLFERVEIHGFRPALGRR